MNKEVRWRQRFSNFEKAYKRLTSAISGFAELSPLEQEGLIQRFEYTFELAWKTVKDYLEANEVDAKFPRDVIKAGFHYGIIEAGEVWMDMLEKRNLMAHTYNEETFNYVIELIRNQYYSAVTQVYAYFEAQQ